jgi:hypothetical protein
MDMRIQLLSLLKAFDKLAPEPATNDALRLHRNRIRISLRESTRPERAS